MTGEGCAIPTGQLLHLDQDALAVVRSFIRPGGRGLSSPVRCAEAIYRFTVRRGMSAAKAPEPQPELPFDPVRNPLDALAAECAALDREPGPEEIARTRDLVGVIPLLNALFSVGIARDGGARRLADGYRGSARFALDRVAAEVDAAIARGQCRPETKTLFNELHERARLAARKARKGSGEASDDLDKLVQRIRALRAKTVEQGCTEQEALAAAEKVAELLDRYGLSLSELDLRKQSCEGIGVDTGRKRRGPINDCMGMIAAFFYCRVWGATADNGTLRYIFFGLRADVQAAVYLHDHIVLAFVTETGAFQAAAFYGSLQSGQRRPATNSFQIGMAQGVNQKLNALRKARSAAANGSNGRALVPLKQSIIDQEMDRLGLSFRRASPS